MEAIPEKRHMLLDAFLTNMIIFAVAIWLIVFIICLLSVSRRTDIGFATKIFWAAVIFFAPVIGLIFYIVFGFPRRKRQGKEKTT